jgi:hypothetical protein
VTISVVQSVIINNGFSGNFAAAVTTGNSIVLIASGYNAGGTGMNSSNPLYNGAAVTGAVKLIDVTGGAGGFPDDYIAAWLLPDVQSSGTSLSITVTNSASAAYVGIGAYEVAGLGTSPVPDKTSSGSGAGAGNQDTGSTGAITYAPEFVIAGIVQDGTAGTTPGTPWSAPLLFGSQNTIVSYQIVTSSGGSYDYDATAGNANWGAVIATIAATLPPAVTLRAAPPLKGSPAARKGTLTGARGQAGMPAPFTPPHLLLRGPAARVPARLTGLTAPPPAAVQASSLNPSPVPQPGGRAWRARFRRRQAPWLQPGPPPVTGVPVTIAPALLHGPAAAVKGRLTGLTAPPPVIPGPPAPFYPPHLLLRGPAARVLARLTGFAVPTPRPPRASPFYPPHVPLRGPAARVLARLTGARGRPGVPAPFTPPHVPSRGPGAARAGRLTGLVAPPPVLHPAVASVFKLPGFPLSGPAAARKGGAAGVIAPPPVIHPSVPSPFTPPHVPLRGPVPAVPRTKTTGAVAPPPAPPPVAPPHWQGSTHMIAATATGNLIQGANHTGRGGPGTDPKGDYERSGD